MDQDDHHNTKMSSEEASDSTGSTDGEYQPSTRDILSDIHSLLNDEELTDIHLIPESIDENETITTVPAIKALLAARSPVFRRCLYGEWKETQSKNNDNDDDDDVLQVKLDYTGRVLQLLVEFCFTDKLASLTDNDAKNNSTLEEKVRLLTQLNGAAHYFDIPKLEQDIRTHLNVMMSQHPSLACATLDEASKVPSGEELGLLAMERIHDLPKAALLLWNHNHQQSHGNNNGSIASTINNAANNAYNGCGWGERGGVIAAF